MEFIFILMVPSTKEIGSRTNNMVVVKKLGLIALFMKDNTRKEKKKEKESLFGAIMRLMMETLVIIIFMVHYLYHYLRNW